MLNAKIDEDEAKYVAAELDVINSAIDRYGDKEIPPDVYKDLMTRLTRVQHVIDKQAAPPDLEVVDGKNPYFNNPLERLNQIKAQAGGYAAGSKEAAYSFVLKLLNTSKLNIPDVVEILQELITQWNSGQPLDFRGVHRIRSEWDRARHVKYMRAWRALVAEDWRRVCRRYDATAELYFDFEKYRAYPIALTVSGEVDEKLTTRPDSGKLGHVITYNKEEYEIAKKWEKQIAQPMRGITTIGTLQKKTWSCGVYPRGRPEKRLYQSLHTWVEKSIDEFKKKHGGEITRVMYLKDFMPQQNIFKMSFVPAYKIVLKKKEQVAPKTKTKKKGLFGFLK